MPHLNVEIKASCDDPDRIRDLLQERDADSPGVDHQVDTYFDVGTGRLKLREGNIENHLIYYERPDRKGPKEAEIHLFETEPGSRLKTMLSKSVGILGTVEKEREIYFLENVKFHIDKVKGLGSFVEIEAIDRQGEIGREQLHDQCQKYLELFGIPESDLVEFSYIDMIT